MTLLQDDLRCNIARCPTKGVCARLLDVLREREVCEFQISLPIYEQVLWFEVAVDDPFAVEVSARIETYRRSGEASTYGRVQHSEPPQRIEN